MRVVGSALLISLQLLYPGVGAAQGDPSSYPQQTAYPKESKSAVSRHLSLARRIAGDDLAADMRWRCLISPLDSEQVRGVQHDGRVPATVMAIIMAARNICRTSLARKSLPVRPTGR